MENVIESELIRIPVKNLVLSPLNVRKKQGGGIEELAALIASQGLIHNLVVRPRNYPLRTRRLSHNRGKRRKEPAHPNMLPAIPTARLSGPRSFSGNRAGCPIRTG